jgi:hypothetical protein
MKVTQWLRPHPRQVQQPDPVSEETAWLERQRNRTIPALKVFFNHVEILSFDASRPSITAPKAQLAQVN